MTPSSARVPSDVSLGEAEKAVKRFHLSTVFGTDKFLRDTNY